MEGFKNANAIYHSVSKVCQSIRIISKAATKAIRQPNSESSDDLTPLLSLVPSTSTWDQLISVGASVSDFTCPVTQSPDTDPGIVDWNATRSTTDFFSFPNDSDRIRYPGPPHDDERKYYFHGLPQSPKLIARSDCLRRDWNIKDVFDPYSVHGSIRKAITSADDENLMGEWRDPGSPFRDELTDTVKQLGKRLLQYNIVTCELQPTQLWGPGVDRLHVPPKGDPIVLITVRSGTVPWVEAYEVADKVQTLLNLYGFNYVHCEIKDC